MRVLSDRKGEALIVAVARKKGETVDLKTELPGYNSERRRRMTKEVAYPGPPSRSVRPCSRGAVGVKRGNTWQDLMDKSFSGVG